MIKNLADMKQKFRQKVCNQFLVHGNITDHLPLNSHYTDLREWLLDWLESIEFDMVIFYDLSAGMQFPDPSHEKLFREITGLTKPIPKISDEEKERLSSVELAELEEKLKELENLPEPELPKAPPDVFTIVEQIAGVFAQEEKRKYRLALIVEYAETIAPAETGSFSEMDRINTVALRRLAQERIAGDSLVVLISHNLADIHNGLRGRGSRLKTVDIPLPQKEQRLKFIKYLKKQNGHVLKLTPEELAHNTGGLSLREIEDIWKESKVVNLEIITREKSRYLEDEFGDVLKVIKPRWGLDDGIGGMDHIKDYSRELKLALIKGDPRLVPPAIILMGPPGTGKSALAEALAFEWGVPFVEILNLRSMFVGESERITLKVMAALQSLSPCVIFWDEFDQEEAPRGSYQGDSGVSARLRKIRFQITSDPRNRGKFLIIYATNRPDLIDIADKRSGRGSVRIPMLYPDIDEMVKIFTIMPVRYNFQTAVKSFDEIVLALKKKHKAVSGADIEEISLLAYRQASLQGHKKVLVEDYIFAINDFVPSPYNATLVKQQEKQAVLERSSNRFLSKRGWEILKSLGQGGL